MDENLHKDNLNQFFKKHLDQQDNLPSKDGWDTPSSEVWNNIDLILDKDRTPTVSIYWKWSALAAAIVGIVFTIFFIRQCQQSNTFASELLIHQKEINDLKNIIHTYQQDDEDKPSSNRSISDVQSQLNSQEVPKLPDTTLDPILPNRHPIKTKTPIDNVIPSDIVSKPDILPNDDAQYLSSSSISSSINSSNHLVEDVSKDEISQISDLEIKLRESIQRIDSKMNVANDESVSLKLESKVAIDYLVTIPIAQFSMPLISIIDYFPKKDLLPSTKTTKHTNKPRWIFGAYIAPTFRSYCVEEEGRRSNQFRDTEMEQVASNIGLQLTYENTKNWGIVSGVQLQQHRQKGMRPHIVNYSTNGREMTADGIYRNDYNIELRSSLGTVAIAVPVYEESDAPILNEGTEIPLVLKTQTQIDVLSVPLMLQYRFSKERFSFALRTGFAANFVQKANLEVEQVHHQHQHQHTRFRERPFRKRIELEELKNTSYDWLGGLAIQYDLGTHWQVEANPMYRIGLSPISDSSHTNTQTTPHAFAVHLGVNYIF